MSVTTVKVSVETRDRLRSMGDGTMEDTIVDALDALEERRFWEQADAAARWLAAQPEEYRQARAAREAELDRALGGR